MIIKYAVHTERSQQITEDKWSIVPRSLEIDDNTTIYQIRKWLEKVHGPDYSPIEFHITQLEKI